MKYLWTKLSSVVIPYNLGPINVWYVAKLFFQWSYYCKCRSYLLWGKSLKHHPLYFGVSIGFLACFNQSEYSRFTRSVSGRPIIKLYEHFICSSCPGNIVFFREKCCVPGTRCHPQGNANFEMQSSPNQPSWNQLKILSAVLVDFQANFFPVTNYLPRFQVEICDRMTIL